MSKPPGMPPMPPPGGPRPYHPSSSSSLPCLAGHHHRHHHPSASSSLPCQSHLACHPCLHLVDRHLVDRPCPACRVGCSYLASPLPRQTHPRPSICQSQSSTSAAWSCC